MNKNNTKDDRTKDENERQYQAVDLLLSIHSSLRDKHGRWSFWLNTFLIGISLFLCVFAFVGDDILELLVNQPKAARVIVGFFAVIVLILSITEFRVDWKASESNHANAASHLSALKAKYRKAFAESAGKNSRRNAQLTIEYDETMKILPPIPNRYFVQLKANHLFKANLSQRVSQNPNVPVWILRLQLRLQGCRAALKGKVANEPDPAPRIWAAEM